MTPHPTRRFPRWHQLMVIALVMVLVALSWSKDLNDAANAQVDAGLKRSLVSFASARALNAVISVVQGTEVVVHPLGLGITLAAGQILDPINDLVEQFSSIMLWASVAFGIQKLLLTIGATWTVSAAVTGLALVWAVLFWFDKAPQVLSRVLVLAVFLRLVMPLTTLGSAYVFEKFLAADYASSLLDLNTTGAELKKLNGGAAATAPAPQSGVQTPATPGPSSASSTPPPAASAQKKTLLSQARDLLSDAKDTVSDVLDASASKLQARIDRIQAMAERAAERVITQIVIFLMQTLVVPLVLLFCLYRLLGGLVPHQARVRPHAD